MKFVEFKKNLEQKTEYSVYLFEGEDAYFRTRGLTLLKNAYLSEESLNLATFEGEDEITKIRASLDSYPFMSPKRLTVVNEFYPNKSEIEQLKDYLENPHLDSILVILDQKKCEGLKKFQNVCVVDCSKQDASLLVKWIKAECNRNGVNVTLEASNLLVDYCLQDMSRIEQETHKLIAYVGAGATINVEDVSNNVSMDTEYKIYEMTDYIAKKDISKALGVIYDMLAKGETTQRLLVSVYNYFSRLLNVAISEKSDIELSKILKIKEFAVKKARQQSARFKKKTLKRVVDMLCDTDFNVKNGKIDAEEGLWLCLFKIMTEE